MMGICEATRPDDEELVSVAKSYLSMNDSKIFSSETANDRGTYIFLSARYRLVRLTTAHHQRRSTWHQRRLVLEAIVSAVALLLRPV